MEDSDEEKGGEPEVSWQPKNYYCPSPKLPYATILLNQGVSEANWKNVLEWWCNASVRLCVDGATNSFHHLMQQKQQESTPRATVSSTASYSSCPLPDIISGDFDSIQPELLKIYAAKGVSIVPTPDQDETDFTKALRVLASLLKERQMSVNHILVMASSNNSRFDHILAIVATLYKAFEIVSIPVVVVWERSLFWVLKAGQHSIQVPPELCHDPLASWCSLVPVGQPVTVTTNGLKWNLDHQTLAFGRMVSTSNTYQLPPCGGKVTVTTSGPLLWTMEWMAEPGHSKVEYPELQNGS